MRKKKDHTLLLIMTFILASLFLMALGNHLPEKEISQQPILASACEYKEHFKVYLAVGEKYVLDDTGYVSADEQIASVHLNRVEGLSPGTTTLRKDCNIYEIEVTELITLPEYGNKKLLPCGQYSNEENEQLDEILATRIAERGYHTRAGVVEAARFLSLRFPYQLKYFFENGRMSGKYQYDGEGRYYHTGLYLSEEKKEGLARSYMGSATWGCSIYDSVERTSAANGLDCSGFISWALLNGGYDCGDIGAGPMENVYDLSDLGTRVSMSKLDLEQVRPGDLVGFIGHIGIVIGKSDEKIYTAEAYWEGNLHVKEFTYEGFLKDYWRYVILMDDYYEEDGKMTNMWVIN